MERLDCTTRRDCDTQQRDEGAGGSYNDAFESPKRPVCGEKGPYQEQRFEVLMDATLGQNTVAMQLVAASTKYVSGVVVAGCAVSVLVSSCSCSSIKTDPTSTRCQPRSELVEKITMCNNHCNEYT